MTTRRTRLDEIGSAAIRNGRNYLLIALGQGFLVGFVTWLVCRVADVPAPAPLGLIIGMTSLMPYLGIVLGSIPALLLTAGFRSFAAAGVLLAVFVAMQVGQIVVQRRLRGRVMYVGPALITVVFLLGYDVYGIGGALFGTAIGVFVMALAGAIGTDDPEADAPDADVSSGPSGNVLTHVRSADAASGQVADRCRSRPAGDRLAVVGVRRASARPLPARHRRDADLRGQVHALRRREHVRSARHASGSPAEGDPSHRRARKQEQLLEGRRLGEDRLRRGRAVQPEAGQPVRDGPPFHEERAERRRVRVHL